jgi:oxalate decarboxylase/phosphoglucose isomerase-like protein (cupin superfamily)
MVLPFVSLPRFKEITVAKDALVPEDMAKKFATEKDSPYVRWVHDEGLDIIGAHYVPDLNTVELKPWDRRGGAGVFINHEATRTSNDCYVCEIPAGRQLAPQRQLFEEQILVLSGNGSTTVWNDAGAKVTFEWGPGSLFAIPLNASHQHFNGSGTKPARFVSSTNLPPIINLYDDVDFVFNTSYDFPSRFSGEPDYFSNKGVQNGLLLETNFVADAINLPLISAKERGAGGGHIRFAMAKGSMNSHISQFPTATYKKGHRHGPGAHVIILSGEGYSLMWAEGEEPTRYEWHAGSMIVPPNMWYHQHFNTGTEPARYLAFKAEVVSVRNAQGVPKAWISQRIGGDQIDYADESKLVRDLFAKALAESGQEPAMDEAYQAELKDLPPKPAVGAAAQG